MICQRCTKDVAGDGVHTCTPSALVRKLEEHRDALLIDLAASLGREDALLATLKELHKYGIAAGHAWVVKLTAEAIAKVKP